MRFETSGESLLNPPIVAGGKVRIEYRAERLTQCRNQGWKVTARYFNKDVTPIAISDVQLYPYQEKYLAGEITLNATPESLELWFENSDDTGCLAYDSKNGANYKLSSTSLKSIGQIEFTKDWKSIVHGTLQPGGGIEINYDPARLPTCRATYHGGRTYNIYANYRFSPGGQTGQTPLFIDNYYAGDEAIQKPVVYVPTDATAVELWFYNNDMTQCMAWDSAFGKNYRFAVSAPLAIGWAGHWGGRFNHGCEHTYDITNPVVFQKSGLGHDCMVVTAEVWVPGLTDKNGDASRIRAEVETNMPQSGGPLAELTTYPLTFGQRVGNNYRFEWSVVMLASYAERGDYQYRFRFSVDDGATWTTLGKSDGGMRTLALRNDSQDMADIQYCDDLETWSSPFQHTPACLSYRPITHLPANPCEFWVDGVGDGNWSHGAAFGDWVEAYLKLDYSQNNEVVEVANVGMLTHYRKTPGGEIFTATSLGYKVDDKTYRTGFTYNQRGEYVYEVVDFAFFVDLRLTYDRGILRVWNSNNGKNYGFNETFAGGGYVQNIGSGSVTWAKTSVPALATKHACGR
jgi:hypothetical protein